MFPQARLGSASWFTRALQYWPCHFYSSEDLRRYLEKRNWVDPRSRSGFVESSSSACGFSTLSYPACKRMATSSGETMSQNLKTWKQLL